ncbi:putative DNA-invertase (Site-specific recombinase) [Methanolobus psychrophilus R15]|nr:putative DNA-invertase (Site-specific recombinase) [Methanolobus psychrophilus R15]
MMTKNVAIYIRTSTDKQEESILMQRQELQKYCSLKDYEIVKEYVDSGWSGKDDRRPEFQRMLSDAKLGIFDILIVTKIDRFARSTMDLLISIEKLKELNVYFIASTQPIDTTSSMGRLTLQIMAAFAEFERNIIVERMQAGRINAEKNGKMCHRKPKEFPKKQVVEYIQKGLSCNAISKLYNTTPTTIKKNLNNWGYKYEFGEWVLK